MPLIRSSAPQGFTGERAEHNVPCLKPAAALPGILRVSDSEPAVFMESLSSAGPIQAVSAAAARDADIVALLRGGRQNEAFALLFERYEQLVYRLCRGLMHGATADDAAQEAFVRIWRSLHSFDGSAALSTWIYTVARNSCFTLLRGEGNRARRFESLDEDEGMEIAAEAAPEVDERAVLTVQDAVQALPERQRVVLQLFYWQDHSVDEVANMLGMPEGTVKTLLHRARQRLATQLSGHREALL
jgi:RNA polymerase sigma-70 factor, ECF subfamily